MIPARAEAGKNIKTAAVNRSIKKTDFSIIKTIQLINIIIPFQILSHYNYSIKPLST